MRCSKRDQMNKVREGGVVMLGPAAAASSTAGDQAKGRRRSCPPLSLHLIDISVGAIVSPLPPPGRII